jgi:hypothetical protein
VVYSAQQDQEEVGGGVGQGQVGGALGYLG